MDLTPVVISPSDPTPGDTSPSDPLTGITPISSTPPDPGPLDPGTTAAPTLYSASFDFSGITLPSAPNVSYMRIQATTKAGVNVDTTITIGASLQTADVANLASKAFAAQGYTTDLTGNQLYVEGPKGDSLKSITFTTYTKLDANNQPVPNNDYFGPKLVGLTGGVADNPTVMWNGTVVKPT